MHLFPDTSKLPTPADRRHFGERPSGREHGDPASLAVQRAGGVSVTPLACRSILNRCRNPQMPFDWTVNPYRGCEFACAYCYARYTHEFLDTGAPASFERDIFYKEDVEAALRRDLARRVDPGEPIAIGTATDPYQPVERTHRVTRSLLEVLAEQRGHVVSITTKSCLIRRDRDLLVQIGRRNDLSVNFSMTSLDRVLARRLEPRAPTPQRRLQTMRLLHDAGIVVGLFLMPVLPGITDDPFTIGHVVAAAAGAGAVFAASNVLFLRTPTRSVFLDYVREHHPEQLAAYERAYAGSGYLSTTYRNRISARVRDAARRNGLGVGRPAAGARRRSAQLSLEL